MKVYVVSQGEYSDRHIIAVFSTRDKAELYVAMHRDDERSEWKYQETYDIEEFELDEVDIKGKVYYALEGHFTNDYIHISQNYTTSLSPIDLEFRNRKHDNTTIDFKIPVPDPCYNDSNWELVTSDRNKKVVYDAIAKYKTEQLENQIPSEVIQKIKDSLTIEVNKTKIRSFSSDEIIESIRSYTNELLIVYYNPLDFNNMQLDIIRKEPMVLEAIGLGAVQRGQIYVMPYKYAIKYAIDTLGEINYE